MTRSLLVCIPSLSTWEADTAICWANTYGHILQYSKFKKVSLINTRSSDLVTSRTVMARHAIENEYSHTFWFDSDMMFPHDIVSRLDAHQIDIVGAAGRVKCDDYKSFAVNNDGSSLSITECSGLQKVAFIGFGCILIRTSVFEKLGEPWFGGWWENRDNQMVWCFEDHYFCKRAIDCGYEVLVDCDASKFIGHIGSCIYHHQGISSIR